MPQTTPESKSQAAAFPTAHELAEVIGMSLGEVVANCERLGVPMFQGRIDRALFVAALEERAEPVADPPPPAGSEVFCQGKIRPRRIVARKALTTLNDPAVIRLLGRRSEPRHRQRARRRKPIRRRGSRRCRATGSSSSRGDPGGGEPPDDPDEHELVAPRGAHRHDPNSVQYEPRPSSRLDTASRAAVVA